MKALIILFFTTLMLAGVAARNRNTSRTSCMTQQEASEYVLRNLQPGHIRYYIRNTASASDETAGNVSMCTQQTENAITANIFIIQSLVLLF